MEVWNNSTGGRVHEGRGLRLACKSAGNSTGGRVHEGRRLRLACLIKRRQQHGWTCPQPNENSFIIFDVFEQFHVGEEIPKHDGGQS